MSDRKDDKLQKLTCVFCMKKDDLDGRIEKKETWKLQLVKTIFCDDNARNVAMMVWMSLTTTYLRNLDTLGFIDKNQCHEKEWNNIECLRKSKIYRKIRKWQWSDARNLSMNWNI